MTLELALLLFLTGLAGLVLRGGEPRLAKFCAVAVMVALVVAILDLPRELLHRVPTPVAVVPTATAGDATAADTAAVAEIRRRSGNAAIVHVETGPESVAIRLARAGLRGRVDPQRIVLHDGPLAGPLVGSAPAPVDRELATCVAAREVARLDPQRIRVRTVAAPAVGRPTAFEIDLGPAPQELRGRLRVLGPAGASLLEQTIAGPTPGRPTVVRVPWRPEMPGAYEVSLDLKLDGVDFAGRGRVAVAAAPSVTVVGVGAAELAKALVVQGLSVTATPELPASWSGTLVLLDAIAAADQSRVLAFVEDGGGLFLVGSESGGAVPGDMDILASLSPVVRLPGAMPNAGKSDSPPPDHVDPAKANPAKADPAKADPAKANPAKANPAKADPPEENPAKPDPAKPDAAKPDAADPAKTDPKKNDEAKGDTTGARLTNEEREVQRRSIAMVLLLDRSGSMSELVKAGISRMDMAKASARQTAAALDPEDFLGVVSFGDRDRAKVELTMTSVEQTAKIEAALASLRATAQETRIADGLDASRKLLEPVRAPVKYVVVITDGAIDDVREPFTRSVAARYKAAGITLCVVQVLAPGVHAAFDAATQARALARRGNGYLIQQQDFARVPRILSAEVQKLRARAGRPERKDDVASDTQPSKSAPSKPQPSTADQPPPGPPDTKSEDDPRARPVPESELRVHVVEDSNLLEPRPPADEFPPVLGILPVRARPGARTLLAAGAAGTPLLAFANRGLGKIGVWSADLLGPWGARWATDAVFPGRLALWIQSLAPPAGPSTATVVIDQFQASEPVPLPSEVAYLTALTGSPLCALDTIVPRSPWIRTELRGRAADHTVYGLILLVLLAAAEFLLLRWARKPAA